MTQSYWQCKFFFWFDFTSDWFDSGKESMEKVLTAVSEEAAKQNVKEKLENQKKVG